MSTKLIVLLEKIKQLFLNYPFVLLMSFALAFTVLYGIEVKPKEEQAYILLKLGLTFSLGISLQFALKILSQRLKNGFVWQLLGFIFLFCYYFIFPKEEDDFSEPQAFIIIPAFILSHLLVAFIAFLKKEYSELKFWQYNKNLFLNIFLTGVFTGVLTGGVELAILAVQELFNFNFDGKIYAEAFFGLAIFGSTIIFLLFSETGLDYLEKEGKYPVVLKFFTQFILIPLLIIYAFILYFYSAKIASNWELPRGWVSYLILAYSVVGILALLLVHPLKELQLKSWILIFSKIFYYTLVPLIILLFVAIFTRVLQYGYTEARYFVLLISFWLTSIVIYFIFFKHNTIKYIPISLFLFGLFGLIFPYLNAFSVATRSQEKELIELLKRNNILANNKINFEQKIQDTIANNIEDKLKFFSKRNKTEILEPFLNAALIKKSKTDKYWYSNCFKNIVYTNKTNNSYLRIYTSNIKTNLEDYQYLLTDEDFHDKMEAKINQDQIIINKPYTIEKNFELIINGNSKNLYTEFIKMCNPYKNAKDEIKVDDLSFTVYHENYKIKVIFSSINWDKENNSYTSSNIIYLIKTN